MSRGIGRRVSTTLIGVGVVGVGLLVWMLSRWDIQITTEMVSPERGLPRTSGVLPLPSQPSSAQVPQSTIPPTPVISSPTSLAIAPTEPNLAPLPEGIRPGNLRISNPTTHPVRVALLPQTTAALGNDPPPETKTRSPYSQPTHWDFAPGEGQQKGLLVSLPNGNQTFHSGDILFVFAQDGSQRYWGPYVIDRTPQPQWDGQSQMWELRLQP